MLYTCRVMAGPGTVTLPAEGHDATEALANAEFAVSHMDGVDKTFVSGISAVGGARYRDPSDCDHDRRYSYRDGAINGKPAHTTDCPDCGLRARSA